MLKPEQSLIIVSLIVFDFCISKEQKDLKNYLPYSVLPLFINYRGSI